MRGFGARCIRVNQTSEILIRSESTWHYSEKIFYHSLVKECEFARKEGHSNSEKTEISPDQIRISEAMSAAVELPELIHTHIQRLRRIGHRFGHAP